MNICPFASDKQKMDFEYIISPIEGMPCPKGERPTQDQIDQVKDRREMKKQIWEEVSDDVKEMLERVIALTKKASYLHFKEQKYR